MKSNICQKITRFVLSYVQWFLHLISLWGLNYSKNRIQEKATTKIKPPNDTWSSTIDSYRILPLSANKQLFKQMNQCSLVTLQTKHDGFDQKGQKLGSNFDNKHHKSFETLLVLP